MPRVLHNGGQQAKYVALIGKDWCGHCVKWWATFQAAPASVQNEWIVRDFAHGESQDPEYGTIQGFPTAKEIATGADISAHTTLQDAVRRAGGDSASSSFRANLVSLRGAARRLREDTVVRNAVLVVAAVWVLKRLGF